MRAGCIVIVNGTYRDLFTVQLYRALERFSLWNVPVHRTGDLRLRAQVAGPLIRKSYRGSGLRAGSPMSSRAETWGIFPKEKDRTRGIS